MNFCLFLKFGVVVQSAVRPKDFSEDIIMVLGLSAFSLIFNNYFNH